jgi:hypothetical protein
MKLETQYDGYPPETFDVESIEEARHIWGENDKPYKTSGIVRDDNGNMIAEFRAPYEGVYINIHDSGELETIRADYDIPEWAFKSMCEQWLNNNQEDESEDAS